MAGEHRDVPSFWRSPAGVALLVALAAAGFYLFTEHTAHVFGALPYLFLLACPLMHVFMHRGHGGHHGGSTSSRSTDDEQPR
jgi:fatty acid desaturase